MAIAQRLNPRAVPSLRNRSCACVPRVHRLVAGGIAVLSAVLLTAAGPGPAAAAAPWMATGTYTGDGTSGLSIPVGFTPAFVLVKGDLSEAIHAASSSMTPGESKDLVSWSTPTTGGITSLDPGGFTVGSDAPVNASGTDYWWAAFRAIPGEIAVGSYPGTGIDDTPVNGVGFQPDCVIIWGENDRPGVIRFPSEVGDASLGFDWTSESSSRIKAFEADGFRLGLDDRVNGSGVPYHYVAFQVAAGALAGDSYLGDGFGSRDIPGVGFPPQLVLVKSEWITEDLVLRPASLVGDATLHSSNDANFTGGVRMLGSSGFQVGAHTTVNGSGATIHYAAFGEPETALDVSSTAAKPPAGDQLSWAHAVGPGSERVLMVGLSFRRSGADSATGVTYGGVPLTRVGTAQSTDPGEKYRAEIWYLVAPAVGTDLFTVTFSGADGIESAVGGARSFTGIDQATPYTTFAGAGGVTGTPSTLVTSGAGDIVFDVLAIKGLGPQLVSGGAGQTETWKNETGNNANDEVVGASSTEPGGGDVTMSWNVASQEHWALAATALQPAPSGEFTLETGTYVGTGVAGLAVSTVGFSPDLVIVKGEVGEPAAARTSTMSGDETKLLGTSSGLITGGVTSLDAGGFTVGSHASVNTAAVTYHWTAFRAAPGVMHVGSYPGNEIDGTVISGVGFQPSYVMVMSTGNHDSVQRYPAQTGDTSLLFSSFGESGNRIQAMLPDGFEIGSHIQLNQIGNTHHYVAWSGVVGRTAGDLYTGDQAPDRDITGSGFRPEFVLLTPGPNSGGTSMRPASVTGDLTLPADGGAPFTDGIKALLPDGFRIGTDTEVNKTGNVHYWFAIADSVLPNSPPVADAGGPYAIAEGDSLSLDASGSSDGDADPLIYGWDLNADGSFADAGGDTLSLDWSALQAFGIDDDSTYAVSVRVFDGLEADTASVSLTTANTAPILSATGPATATEGQPYTLSLAATDPGDDTVTSWTIQWGDGVIDTLAGSPPAAQHTYVQPGFDRVITLAAQDEDGSWTSSDLIVGNWVPASDELHRYDGSSGAFDTTLSSASGLARPYGMAVGPDGSLFVSGYSSNNIGRFDSTGTFLGVFASGNGLGKPCGLAFGPDGNLYVANFNSHDILRFDGTTGAFLGIFGSGLPLDGPTGLAFGPDGDLYVSCWNMGVLVKLDGTLGGTPTTVIGAGLNAPEQLAFDGAGNLYIADGGANDVKKWDGGTLTSHFTSPDLSFATGLTFGPDGQIYVVSHNNARVLRYDGSVVTTFVAPGSGGLSQPEYLLFTPEHRVTVQAAGGPLADLSVSKIVSDPSPDEGAVVKFTVVCGNAGPDSTWDVTLTDVLPTGLTFAADSASQGTYVDSTGAWAIGPLASGDSVSLWIDATVDAGTGGSTLTNLASVAASALADSNSSNDVDSVAVTVNVPTGITVAAAQTPATVAPGKTNAALMSVSLANSDPSAYTLQSITFTNATVGTGSQPELDAELGLLTLFQDDGDFTFEPGQDTPLTTTTASGGTVSFTGLSVNVPSGSLGSFHVGADLPLAAARDGDALDLSISGAASIVFDQAVTFVNGWPLDPAGAVTVDGMVAAQIGMNALGNGGLITGSSDGLVLDVTLPSNGYAADTLEELRLTNRGTAVDGTDLAALKVWGDGGDGAFDAGVVDDVLLGTMVWISSEWKLQGLSVPVPVGGLQVFVSVDIAPGATIGNTVELRIPTGVTSVMVTSANDGPHDAPVDGPDTFTIQGPPGSVSASATQAGGTLRPGTSPVEVLELKLVNASAAAETLSAVTLTNATTGPGTAAERDAEWQTLELEVVGVPYTASFSESQATFTGIDAEIAPGDTLVLTCASGAALAARDGDFLDIVVADSIAFVFTRAVDIVAAWPLDPMPTYTVDGMTAAQVGVPDLGLAPTLRTGTLHNVSLVVDLPANGYEQDTLLYLHAGNLGTAEAFLDLEAVEAWWDFDGDGQPEPEGDDAAGFLGEMAFTGNRWEKTALNLPIPPGGRRIFLTTDIAPLATVGADVRFVFTTSPEFGLGVASGNDGPIDQPVPLPSDQTQQTITTSDRVTFSSSQLTPGGVAPGQANVPLLRLHATNDYLVVKTLTGLTVDNATMGSGTLAELDAEIGQLRLHADGTGGPLLGTASFSGGLATFSGFNLALSAGGTRNLWVIADVALTQVADGDVIGAQISGPSSTEFSDPTTAIATWPLDSRAQWTVNGMVAEQIEDHGAPPTTLGPSEGPVLALDVTLPANGYLPDVLQGLRVTNEGTALPADLADVHLWRDGGDGVFNSGAADDTDLGSLTPVGGDWTSPLVADPVPLGGGRYFVSVSTSATPADGRTVQLAIPTYGVTVESGNDGPWDARIVNVEEITLSTAALLASLEITPERSTLGDSTTVTMLVRNLGAVAIDSIVPSPLLADVPGILGPVTGPNPAWLDLSVGAQDVVTWTYQATAAGTVRLSGDVTGTEQGSAIMRQSLNATSNAHQVFLEALELDLFSVHSMPFSVNRGQIDVVPLSLTFANNAAAGGSDIRILGLRVRLADASGAGVIPADLLSRVVVKEGANVYVEKTALETSGDTVDLTLATPVLVPPEAAQVTLSISLDISPTTTIPGFRVQIPDDTFLDAEDAVSLAPASALLDPGESYPIQSGLAQVVTNATELDVSAASATSIVAGQGQGDVPMLGLSLLNPDPIGLAADVRLRAFDVVLVDSAGVQITQPWNYLERIRVEAAFQTLVDQPVSSGDDPTIALVLSPLVSVPVNNPVPIVVEADLSDTAPLEGIRLQLADSTQVDARDANTGAQVPAVYASDPVQGPLVRLLAPADSMLASGSPRIPSRTPVGATGVPALTIVLRHSGDPLTGPVSVDSVTLECRDEALRPLTPDTFVTRARVLRGGGEVGLLTDLPVTGGEFTVPLAGVTIDPGQVDSLSVLFDAEVDAPASFFQLMVPTGGIAARDAQLALPVPVTADAGAFFPFTSGVTQLESAARELVVGFHDSMPATLTADGSTVTFATVTLENPADAAAGVIAVDGLTVQAADRDFAPQNIGAAIQEVEAWIGDVLLARSGPLTPSDGEARLPIPGPLAVSPGTPVDVELRAVLRSDDAPASLRLGLPNAGIDVVQSPNPLLTIVVTAAAGQTFPFWTEPANFSGTSLEDSWSNFPNPFAAGSEQTRFAFFLPQPGAVTLKLFTLRGEAVRTLVDGEGFAAGMHQDRFWDGRNGSGQVVVNGVYLAEISVSYDDGSSARHLRKIAVVR